MNVDDLRQHTGAFFDAVGRREIDIDNEFSLQHEFGVWLREREKESKPDEVFSGKCERLENLLTDSPEGGCSAPPSPTGTGHYVLSLAALSQNGYLSGNAKSVSPTKAMLKCRIGTGDLLIPRSNTQVLVGLAGIFDENRDDVSFPDTMMRLHVDKARIDTIMKLFLGRTPCR